jgi:protein-disulfide isomerase
MKIKIIGSVCPTCIKLYQWILKLREEGKIDKKAEVEYSKDINELIELGVMGSPALVVNGKVVSVGMPSNEKELIEIINKNLK